MVAVPAFRVFRGPDGLADTFGPTVLAFGKFDGVHLGHRALLERAAAAGRRLGLPHGAATFERHPYAFLRGGPVPPVLTGLGEKLRLFREAGACFVVLFPADASVLGVPAEGFARDVLRSRMNVRLVVVGANFRFGRGGAGGVVTLRRLTATTGLDGVEVGMTTAGGEAISATRIRSRLGVGDVGGAEEMLGRPHEVLGRTNARDGRTATVLVPVTRAVPAAGRYSGSVASGRLGEERKPALVTVHTPDDGPHRLQLEVPSGAPDHGPVRVLFGSRSSCGS